MEKKEDFSYGYIESWFFIVKLDDKMSLLKEEKLFFL